jgi:preprotein translocase subunit SecD
VPTGEAARLWLYGVSRRVLANQRRGELRRSALGAGYGPSCPTVALQLDEKATGELGDLTRELVGSTTQVALVLDGEVLSAPTIMSVIDTGQLQLAGDFTKSEATELAARLAE